MIHTNRINYMDYSIHMNGINFDNTGELVKYINIRDLLTFTDVY